MFLSSVRATSFGRTVHPLRFALWFMLLAVCSAPVYSQSGIESLGTGGKHTIQGRIYFPSGRRADTSVKVRLESPAVGELSVFTDRNGSFVFKNLTGGSYTVFIEGTDDYETVRESVYIDETTIRTTGGRISVSAPRIYSVPVYLMPKRTVSRGAKPGVINAALANAPKPAAELYTSAQEALRAGNVPKAIEQLRAAVSIYPEFALAHGDLGILYLKQGQIDRAIESLRTSIKLSPEAFMPRLSYGIALLEKKAFAEAEAELREAVKRNDSAAMAHLYLGITLISLQRYEESEKELMRAVTLDNEQMSLAHYYLGGIYWRKKDYKRAADELETYLKLVPKAPNAEKIRATVKELRSK